MAQISWADHEDRTVFILFQKRIDYMISSLRPVAYYLTGGGLPQR